MATLMDPWAQFGADEIWHAAYKSSVPLNGLPVMNLTVWQDQGGLWRAVVEYRHAFGSWPAPSPFSSRELAQQWAEARAEQIGARP